MRSPSRNISSPASRLPSGGVITSQQPPVFANKMANAVLSGAVVPDTTPTNWNPIGNASIGGVIPQIVATGIEDGLPFIDLKWTGTTSSAIVTAFYFDITGSIIGAVGDIFTTSFYHRLIAGTFPVATGYSIQVATREHSGAAFVAQSQTAFTPTATKQRVSASRTFTSGDNAVPTLRLDPPDTVGLAIDFTVRISGIQCEKNAVATTWDNGGNNSQTPEQVYTPPAPTYDADAEAFFTRAEATGTTLTTAYKDATDTLVKALKATGEWANIKTVHNFAAPTEAIALLNIKDNTKTAVKSTTFGFTANDGFKFTGDNQRLYVPHVFPQNLGTIGIGYRAMAFAANARLYSDDASTQHAIALGATEGTLSNIRFNAGGNPNPMPTGVPNLNGTTFNSRSDANNCRIHNGAWSSDYTRGSFGPTYTNIGLGGYPAHTVPTMTHMICVDSQMTLAVEDAIHNAFVAFRAAMSAPAF